jgi:hypothetical protein
VDLSGKRDVNTRFLWGKSKVREHLEGRDVGGPVLIRHYEDVRQAKYVCDCVCKDRRWRDVTGHLLYLYS